MITVKELIKLLKTCDPNATVCLSNDNDGNLMHDFYELEQDEKNIYFIPTNDVNEYWDDK